MTTAHFRTTSNTVEVTDKEAVVEILQEYDFSHFDGESLLEGPMFSIRTPEMPNHGFRADKCEGGELEIDVTKELYKRIAEYLTEPLEVNTVQTAGVGHGNVTLTVTPDGEIERENHSPVSC